MYSIHTIGHSDHDLDGFLALLRTHQIDVVADVRSSPYSRRLPHFSRSELEPALKRGGINYAYLGEQLGGRPSAEVRAQMHGNGYAAMAATASFQAGIDRLIRGRARYRTALLCAERDPAQCHRALLVGRALARQGATLLHILADGSALAQSDFERGLLDACGHGGADDLFSSPTELLDLAYRHHEMRASGEAE